MPAGRAARGHRLALATLPVCDADEAIARFTRCLGFTVREDTVLGPGERRVVVGPAEGPGVRLARATTTARTARIVDQTGGRVAFVLETDDLARVHARMTEAGVVFAEPPGDGSRGAVAVFLDLHGNRWDLIGRRR